MHIFLLQTSFAQFAPVFIASQSSLNKLNAKLTKPVPMTRFRPNIVVSGCPPHDEVRATTSHLVIIIIIIIRILGLRLK